jgi:hypothetical protein
MTMLSTFILVGMVDSFDPYFATVELNTTPASNGGPSIAVMPVSAFPCEIYEGKIFYVVKLQEEQDATIVCQKDVKDDPGRRKID